MTFLEAALELLKQQRKPLHFKKLAELAIKHDLLDHVGRAPEVAMQTALANAIRKGQPDLLIRVEPGVFGLRYYPPPVAKSEEGAPSKRASDDSDRGGERGSDRSKDKSARNGERPGRQMAEQEDAASSKRSAKEAASSDDAAEEGGRRRRRRRRGRGAQPAPSAAAASGLTETPRPPNAGAVESGAGIGHPSEPDARASASEGDEMRAGGTDMAFEFGHGSDEPMAVEAQGETAESVPESVHGAAGQKTPWPSQGRGHEPNPRASERPQGRGPQAQGHQKQGGTSQTHGHAQSHGHAQTHPSHAQRRPGPQPPREGREARDAREGRDAREDRNDRNRAPAPNGSGSSSYVDAAYQILLGQGDRPLHVRQIIDMAAKRRLIRPDGTDQWRAMRVALQQDIRERLGQGLRPRVRFLGGAQFALADRGLENELLGRERGFADAMGALKRETRIALERRLAKLSSVAFEAAMQLLLGHLGFFKLEPIKRTQEALYVASARPRTAGPARTLISLRAGAEQGRRAVGELRAGVLAKGYTDGLLVVAGQLLEEANTEAAAAGPAVELWDGRTVAELMMEHGVGCLRSSAPVEYLDAEFFVDLGES